MTCILRNPCLLKSPKKAQTLNTYSRFINLTDTHGYTFILWRHRSGPNAIFGQQTRHVLLNVALNNYVLSKTGVMYDYRDAY